MQLGPGRRLVQVSGGTVDGDWNLVGRRRHEVLQILLGSWPSEEKAVYSWKWGTLERTSLGVKITGSSQTCGGTLEIS